MTKAKELRDMSIDELQAALRDTDRQLFDLKNESTASKKIEAPHRIRQTRRKKARLCTIITEKQSMNNQAGR